MTLADALAALPGPHAAAGWTDAAGFDHGEVGARLVIAADGRRAVAKWHWPAGPAALAKLRGSVALVDRVRARGARVPAYGFVGAVGGGVLVLQELLPGETSDAVTTDLVDDVLAHVALQAGLAPGAGGAIEPWTAFVHRSLTCGLSGFCEHGPLLGHGRPTRALLRRIRAAGSQLAGSQLPDRDAVHLDLHHLNVLRVGGRLTGVVDAEGMRGGDRRFDLVTFAFCLAEADCSDAVRERAWQAALDGGDRVAARAYVAHMALRQVDWSLRHRTEADVSRWLRRSHEALERVG